MIVKKATTSLSKVHYTNIIQFHADNFCWFGPKYYVTPSVKKDYKSWQLCTLKLKQTAVNKSYFNLREHLLKFSANLTAKNDSMP